MSITARPSKFAVLAVDSSSESDEEWTQVKGASKTKASVKGKSEESGSNKPPSKNAKKRARKKKNQQAEGAASAEANEPSSISVKEEKQHAQQLEKEFEKELAEALVLSRLEVEAQAKLDKERKEALAAAASRKHKGVTLTLQELHQVGGDLTKARRVDPQLEAPPPDPNFFERLEKEVQKEIKREKQLAGLEAAVPESARVAQLTDELEKKDALVKKLQAENESLVRQLKEVKERNQSLYKILSQGELCNTAELLQQVEQLNTVKLELTAEVNTLNSCLEQERSKNKQFKAELVKLQGKSNAH